MNFPSVEQRNNEINALVEVCYEPALKAAHRILRQPGVRMVGAKMKKVDYVVSAEDVVQAALLKATAGWYSFNGLSTRTTWFLGIVKFEALRGLQKMTISTLGDSDAEHPAPEQAPVEQAEVPKAAPLLRIVERLKNKDALNARIIQMRGAGLSYREIAQTLNVKLGTVKSRLSRSRKTGLRLVGAFSPTDRNQPPRNAA